MFIEVAEILRCPGDHEVTYCVLTADVTEGRRVVEGVLGCPVCESEYSVVAGVVEFGHDPLLDANARSDDPTQASLPIAGNIAALLALEGPGGYVVLVGSACRAAGDLSSLLPGVHFVGVNPPPDVSESDHLSVLRSTRSVPIGSSLVRGVVVGTEYAADPLLVEAGRVLLTGLRMVVVGERIDVPGVDQLASGMGLWVGAKRAK